MRRKKLSDINEGERMKQGVSDGRLTDLANSG